MGGAERARVRPWLWDGAGPHGADPDAEAGSGPGSAIRSGSQIWPQPAVLDPDVSFTIWTLWIQPAVKKGRLRLPGLGTDGDDL